MTKPSTYSFGADSPLKFDIPDKTAEAYNEAMDGFLKAQHQFKQKFGRRWDPLNDPIVFRFKTDAQKNAWDTMADLLSKHVENDGRYYPEDFMDDFLVKNTSSAAAVGVERWGRLIALAAMCGALYGFLRGR